MRILGFSKKWDKLNKQWFQRDIHTFTTFRYPRRDRDWEVEEIVQVVYKPRSKEREPLGIARIIRKQEKNLDTPYYGYQMPSGTRFVLTEIITPAEAEEDGFTGRHGGGDREAMREFIREPGRPPLINKLTLYWIERFDGKT